MRKKKLLDLCCCSGGASMGYHLAGFEVTGVYFVPQPNYPFTFIQRDAIEALNDFNFISQFDVIHASPPCQGYSSATKDDSIYVPYSQGKQTPRLIATIRDLIPKGMPFIIENVAGAKGEMIEPFALTGYMFGLAIERKRYFETNLVIEVPKDPKMRGYTKRYAEANGIDYRDMSVTGKSRRKGSIQTWKDLMGMQWCGRAWELSEAIPPAYTEYIGKQIINLVQEKTLTHKQQLNLF